MQTIINYLKDIRAVKSTSIATETSYYPAFQTMLSKATKKNITVITDAKKQEAGKPDFTVMSANGDTIGYIEAKKPGTDLDKIETTEQIKRYLSAFPNFILSDFHTFRLYSNGKRVSKICIDDGKLVDDITKTKQKDFYTMIDRFMSKTISIETEVNIIAKLLAGITKDTLKPAIDKRLADEMRMKSGELYNAYTDFKTNLLHDLTTDEFVDMYAQTITYGLLTAKMNHEDDATFDRKNALFDIPKGFGVLHAVFKFIATDTLPGEIKAALDEIVSILIHTDPGRVLKRYYDDEQGKDWFIHFYETFLAEYNAKERKVRGVYYTPDAVVSYITRSVNDILKTKFNKKLGFGDDEVRVLDPAVGTASFITSACQIGIDEMKAARGDGMIDGFIKNHILKRFYGFELMMTPYVLGHLKMKMLLDKNDYPINDEHIRLFLTNTLDVESTKDGFIHHPQTTLSEIGMALIKEARCVNKVHKKTILAVIGNPPYSVSTGNKGMFDDETEVYKAGVKVDRDGLKKEKNILPLSDDYIKFMRFAHKRIDDQGEGVVGFITNNSYLGGLIHRGMRKELMKSFDEIYILNLHGNIRTDPKSDKNVFDIMQGVSIAIFVKTTESEEDAKVYYSELIGSRESKYGYLDANDINTTKWAELDVCKPRYFFEPKDFSMQQHYNKFVSISDMFKEKTSGIKTARDRLVIQNTEKDMWNVINDFCNMNIETARQKYNLRNDSASWNIEQAQNDIKNTDISHKLIETILYRPFDTKFTYYTGKSRGFMESPRKKIMQHMIKDNLCICIGRAGQAMKSGDRWNIVMCSNCITDLNIFYRGGCIVSPLYLYTNNTKTPNITPSIIPTLTTTYNTEPTPEDVFYYIYGILHSTIYREKYAELLRIDFPKIPFTTDHDTFKAVGTIGKQLADIHLMKPEVFDTSSTKYEGKGDHTVDKITYDPDTQSVYINKTQHFTGVSSDVWEYQIGGYKPAQKWLKDRRHDVLTVEDIDHYRYITNALERTMELQQDVDLIYPGIDSGELIQFSNAQTTLIQ